MPVNSFLRPMLNARCIRPIGGDPPTSSAAAAGILPHVQSRPPCCHPSRSRRLGHNAETNPRTLGLLLERHSQVKRTRLGRPFYSCSLDQSHLWIAMRYAELNPVRAGLVTEAESWAGSSAAAHCGSCDPALGLEMDTWKSRWSTGTWPQYLSAGEPTEEVAEIRRCTHTGRPLGAPEFLHSLEMATQRNLVPRKGGRPANLENKRDQQVLAFEK